MKFTPTRLEAICSLKTGNLDSNAAVVDGQYPFFTCAPETLRIDKAAFDTEAVLLAGNNAAGIYPLKYYHGEFNAYQRTYVIESLDNDVLSIRYLYYALHRALAHFQSVSIGASTQYLTKSILNNFVVQLPSLVTQNAVVAILSAYDDLIENNRRRMQLLEEAARQLYREWFVRFRFPGYEHTPIINGIPEGWERRRIGNIAECIGGGTPSTSVPAYWEDGDIMWVTPTDVTRNKHLVLLDSEKKITEEGLQNSSAKLVPPHAVLMTSRASVGFFAVAGREVCTNQGFISIVPHDATFGPYLLFHLSERVEEIRAMGSGSTYPEVSRGKFRDFEVLAPTMTLVSLFVEQVDVLLRQIRVLKQQTQKLRAARDLLLPRLMSGQITA